MKRTQKQFAPGTYLALFKYLVPVGYGYRLKFQVLNNDLQDCECYATNRIYTPAEISALFDGARPEAMSNSVWRVTLKNRADIPELLTITLCGRRPELQLPGWFIGYNEAWQGCKNGEPPSEIKKAYLVEYNSHEKVQGANECRATVRLAVRDELSADHYFFEFGCFRETFREHIESTFGPGMNWSNYGKAWVIDHVIPLVKFDTTTPEGRCRANHYLNLRAMTPQENINKWCN